jgi:hypothetical protein
MFKINSKHSFDTSIYLLFFFFDVFEIDFILISRALKRIEPKTKLLETEYILFAFIQNYF